MKICTPNNQSLITTISTPTIKARKSMEEVKSEKSEFELVIEIERIELNVEPTEKGKTLGCWGPSPDDSWNQC